MRGGLVKIERGKEGIVRRVCEGPFVGAKKAFDPEKRGVRLWRLKGRVLGLKEVFGGKTSRLEKRVCGSM